MYDILDRDIKDGDLVVAKGTGKYNYSLRLGVAQNKSVRFKNGSASYNQVYLVENPGVEDLKIKNAILEQIKEDEIARLESKKNKASKKAIPKNKLIIGQEYIADDNYKYIYLGYGKVAKYTTYLESVEHWEVQDNLKGYIYIATWENDSSLVNCDYNTFNNNYVVRKTRKRLVELGENKIDIANKIFEIEENREYNPMSSFNYKHKICFELDDL